MKAYTSRLKHNTRLASFPSWSPGKTMESNIVSPCQFSIRGRTKFGDPNEKTMSKSGQTAAASSAQVVSLTNSSSRHISFPWTLDLSQERPRAWAVRPHRQVRIGQGPTKYSLPKGELRSMCCKGCSKRRSHRDRLKQSVSRLLVYLALFRVYPLSSSPVCLPDLVPTSLRRLVVRRFVTTVPTIPHQHTPSTRVWESRFSLPASRTLWLVSARRREEAWCPQGPVI